MNILTTIAHLCYYVICIIIKVYVYLVRYTLRSIHEGQMRIEMFKADIKFGQCNGRFHTTQKGIKKNIP